jgi:hypothetical protein
MTTMIVIVFGIGLALFAGLLHQVRRPLGAGRQWLAHSICVAIAACE